MDVLTEIGVGGGVSIIPIHVELATQELFYAFLPEGCGLFGNAHDE